jgi:hypothetical protein
MLVEDHAVTTNPLKRGPLNVVNLTALMGRTIGRREVFVGLIDGPVAVDHIGIAAQNIRTLAAASTGAAAEAMRAAWHLRSRRLALGP